MDNCARLIVLMLRQQLCAQVVTSLRVEAGKVTVFASTVSDQGSGQSQFKISIPRLDAYYTGTGDLMTALLLAFINEEPHNLAAAVEKAVAGVQGVLQITIDAGKAAPPDDKSAEAAYSRELRLIQAQHAILQPNVTYSAEDVAD